LLKSVRKLVDERLTYILVISISCSQFIVLGSAVS